jgi:UDP-glucose 4-epimerase
VRSVARGPVAPRPGLTHTRADLCDPAARDALAGVDVLWHLGAQLWRSRDGRQISVNIDGTANVIAARPGRIVLASSAAVYGAYPDNPLPLSEDHPPRPNPECAYAWHKLEAERLVTGGGAPAAVLRISAVLGPNADARVQRATRGYRIVVPAVDAPQALQFLDEDDAAAGLLAAGMASATGTWNLCPADWLDEHDIARIGGGRIVRVPIRVAIAASELGYRLRVLPFGADRSSLLGGPLALDPTRAAADLGWQATRSSAAVLADAVGGQGVQRYMRHVR